MKKKFSLCHFGTYRGFFNLFHGVRVMIFLMLVGLTHVSATASSQNAVINLKLKDVTLEEAVRNAEKQLKQDFFFNKQEIDVNKKVSVDLVNATVADFVRLVFGQDYGFELVDNVIVVSSKPAAAGLPWLRPLICRTNPGSRPGSQGLPLHRDALP